MRTLIKSILGLVFFLVLFHFPLIHISTPTSVNPVYNYDIKNNKNISSTINLNSNEFAFHIPVSGSYDSSRQYEIIKLGKSGEQTLLFKMPLDKDILKGKNPDISFDKDGFVTYPGNGSFFLWYPKLGNQAYFYDQDGQFLWANKTSHYIKAFPSGKYLLSMAGDHSRAFYLLPDLSVLGSAEGTLLISYQFSNEKSADDNSMQVCLGFLDGDIVFYNPAKKTEMRTNVGSLTKSYACNFINTSVAVQIENPDKNIAIDQLKVGMLQAGIKGTSIDWKFSIPLLDRYTSSLPIGLKDDYGIILLPEKKSFIVLAFDSSGKILSQTLLDKEEFNDSGIEDWRISTAKKGLVAWNSNSLYIFNPKEIYSKKMPIENVTIQGDEIFIQTRTQILALQLAD